MSDGQTVKRGDLTHAHYGKAWKAEQRDESDALQNRFADAVTRIEALRQKQTLALSEQEALFASLQARALTPRQALPRNARKWGRGKCPFIWNK